MAAGGTFVCHRPSIHRRLTVVAFSFRRYGFTCALVARRRFAFVHPRPVYPKVIAPSFASIKGLTQYVPFWA